MVKKLDFDFEVDKLCFLLSFFLNKQNIDDALVLLRHLKRDDKVTVCLDLFRIISLIEIRLHKMEDVGVEFNWEIYQINQSIKDQFQNRVVGELLGDDLILYESKTELILNELLSKYKDLYKTIC